MVTNLADSEEGKNIAKGAVQSIKNVTDIEADQVPEAARENLDFIHVFDLQNRSLAHGGLDFGEYQPSFLVRRQATSSVASAARAATGER